MDPLPVVDALVSVLSALPDAVLQINVHDEIFDPDNHWFAPKTGEALLAYECHDHVRVDVHPYSTDEQLWKYLASITVSVLPYPVRTHSGWLEACHDLGTAVIVPSCGFYAQQQPCGVFEFTEDQFDEASLQLAVDEAYDRWRAGNTCPPCPLAFAARPTQRTGRGPPTGLRKRAGVKDALRIALIASNRFPIRPNLSQAGWKPTCGTWPGR